ncbi:hypothetical protein WN943_025540 [Citrus x changshan-huyou]
MVHVDTDPDIQIHAFASSIKFAQQVFGAVAGEDIARSWLNTLPANSIMSWEQMVTKFLNKYFTVHKTNAIRREISEFTQREDEQFFETWERFNGLLSKCPHHRNIKRIKGVNEVHIGESSSEIKEVKAIIEGLSRQIASLTTAKSTEPHDHDSYSDQANAIGVMRKPSNYNPFSNTYNPGWRDHPNFSWSQGFQQNGLAAPAPPVQPIPQIPQASQPPFRLGVFRIQSDPLNPTSAARFRREQAIFFPKSIEPLHIHWFQLNNFTITTFKIATRTTSPGSHCGRLRNHHLSTGATALVKDQTNFKNVTHSTIEQQNRTIDELRNEIRAGFNSQAQSVSSLEKMVEQLGSSVQTLAMNVEKGKFPSQPVPNPKGVHEASISSPQQHGEVKAVMTLRKGKEVDNKVEMSVTKENQIVPVNVDDSPLEKKKETNPREYVPKAPFPQRLAKEKKEKSTGEILEIFKPVSVNIPLLDAIKQVPSYANICETWTGRITPNASGVIAYRSVHENTSWYSGGRAYPGRPLLATADAHIQCRTGNMQLFFSNMTMELNIFNIAKQPHNADDGIVEVNLIKVLVDDTFLSNLNDDPLQTCLTHFDLNFDIDRSVDEVNALLDLAQSMDTNKWKSRVEQLAPSEKKLIPSSKSPSKLELKPLPNILEYAFLGEESTLPIIISSSLNDEQKGKLLDILKEHKGALGWAKTDIKCINPVDCMHYIHLDENAKPTREMQRRLNPNMKEVVRTEVLKLLDADGYSGYTQIPIAPNDQEKTTFTCPFGTFAYRRMTFGLCNAPATFQRCMLNIFSDMVERFLEVFMDEFSVFGDSFDQCLHHLTLVLQRCIEKNLILNCEKCHFMVKQGIVLDHIISSKCIEVDKAKVDLISNLPQPKTVREVRSFLRYAGFYRRFIKDFSKVSKPLCNLLIKDVAFIFDDLCFVAFEKLKQLLTSSPIIQPPNWSLLFELMCDASDYIVGAVLGQRFDQIPHEFDLKFKDKKGTENVVADHLSRLHFDTITEPLTLNESFPDEQLMSVEVLPWLVYGKACHLSMELEHRAYWAIKKFNFDMQQASSERRLQLAKLGEIRNDAYENAKIYKQRMKVFHDKQIMRKSFTPGQKVLLFNSCLHLFPELISYVEDLESQFRDIERSVYNIQLELEFVTPVKLRITVLRNSQNALFTIYKARSERMRLFMRNNITADICWLIEAKVRLTGGNRGLSKLVSKAAFVRGSQVLGIIPRTLKPLDSLSDSPAGEELVVSGDLATLEAFITLASWAHLHIHQKPIAKKLFIYAHTANELLDLLQAYKPEPDSRTLVLESPNNDVCSSCIYREANFAADFLATFALSLPLGLHVLPNPPPGVDVYLHSDSSGAAFPLCSWIGISCGAGRHRVTALNLSTMGLQGTIPPHLGNLSFLVYLNISHNKFHGHLPNELGQLRRLRFFSVTNNTLSGSFPPWIGVLSRL